MEACGWLVLLCSCLTSRSRACGCPGLGWIPTYTAGLGGNQWAPGHAHTGEKMPGLAGLRGVGYESDLRCRLYLSYLHPLRWRAKHQHYYYVSGVHTAYASFVPTQPFTPSRWAVYGFTDALQQRRSLSLVGWGWPGCQPGKRWKTLTAASPLDGGQRLAAIRTPALAGPLTSSPLKGGVLAGSQSYFLP